MSRGTIRSFRSTSTQVSLWVVPQHSSNRSQQSECMNPFIPLIISRFVVCPPARDESAGVKSEGKQRGAKSKAAGALILCRRKYNSRKGKGKWIEQRSAAMQGALIWGNREREGGGKWGRNLPPACHVRGMSASLGTSWKERKIKIPFGPGNTVK